MLFFDDEYGNIRDISTLGERGVNIHWIRKN